jgi:hypothetical protein
LLGVTNSLLSRASILLWGAGVRLYHIAAHLPLDALLLRLGFLARDFLEHHLHPLADHSDPSMPSGLTIASIAAAVSA